MCDMGRDRVQRVQITLVGEVSWCGPKVAYRRRPGDKFNLGTSTISSHILNLPVALFVQIFANALLSGIVSLEC